MRYQYAWDEDVPKFEKIKHRPRRDVELDEVLRRDKRNRPVRVPKFADLEDDES